MKVSEVMSRQVEIASPDDSIQRAAQMMARIDAGILPVGAGDRLVGMITDRDIAIRGAGEGRDPADTPVNEIMTPEVKYCFEDDDVDRVAQNMAELQVRRLPVLNRDKRLTGIISLGDIAREHEPAQAGSALHGIAQKGGRHTQSDARPS
ncbi:MAG TPA: CBS domain-containing protein [Steroidobacteraceae bacterium]|nr:CBS domain-containing protein [Steroidobacteraceae bacterium]